jgi:predicted transcriptional regulator
MRTVRCIGANRIRLRVMGERFPPRLHELESQIMEEAWRQGEFTVRDILDALNDGAQAERAYTTILTVMQRLDGKGLLRRRRRGRKDVYVPALSREEYADARARSEVAALVSEYGDIALAHFSRHMSELDDRHREQVRRLARGA